MAPREQHGRITNRTALEAVLEDNIGIEIDSTKPIVIIYHPGTNPCNKSATSDSKWIKRWHDQLKDGINQVAQVEPIYIYKDFSGLKKYDGILDWKEDPERMIERIFFKRDTPCFSFVVISKDGNFIRFLGEFPKEFVWGATQLMNESN